MKTCSNYEEQGEKVTLEELLTLERRETEQLLGKKGRFWFNARKRLAQGENPFIPSEKILKGVWTRKGFGFEDFIVEPHLDELMKLGMQVCKDFSNTFTNTAVWKPSPEDLKKPNSDIVAVRLGDLLSTEERLNFSYAQMLRKATSEHLLESCDIFWGLISILNLVKECQLLPADGKVYTYVICKRPDENGRVPYATIFPGKVFARGRGYANLTLPPEKGTGFMNDPEARLIFNTAV
jgi:hypothetical protein